MKTVIKYLLLCYIVLSGYGFAVGQLHESISVEGRYVPEYIGMERINTLPGSVNFSLGAIPMNYE